MESIWTSMVETKKKHRWRKSNWSYLGESGSRDLALSRIIHWILERSMYCGLARVIKEENQNVHCGSKLGRRCGNWINRRCKRMMCGFRRLLQAHLGIGTGRRSQFGEITTYVYDITQNFNVCKMLNVRTRNTCGFYSLHTYIHIIFTSPSSFSSARNVLCLRWLWKVNY